MRKKFVGYLILTYVLWFWMENGIRSKLFRGGGGLIFTDINWCTESYKTGFFVLYDMREKVKHATWNCHKFVVKKFY